MIGNFQNIIPVQAILPKEKSRNEIKENIDEYTEEIRKQLQKQLSEFIEVLNKEISPYYLYKDISYRVKTVESLSRKLISKKVNCWRDLSDYCGAAIIIHPLKTVEDIMEILHNLNKSDENYKQFKIVKEENKGPKDSSQFAYRALHCDVLYGDLKIEIQIRTCYQDIWNCISHQDYEIQRLKGYDQAHFLPRELHQISSLLEISESICKSTVKEHGKDTPQLDHPINDTLELKLLFVKKLKYNGSINDWEFNIAYEALKEKGKTKSEDIEILWDHFKGKLNDSNKNHENLIFKFSQFITLDENFNPNDAPNTQNINQVLNKFEHVLQIKPLKLFGL